jgi:hypothetical protein
MPVNIRIGIHNTQLQAPDFLGLYYSMPLAADYTWQQKLLKSKDPLKSTIATTGFFRSGFLYAACAHRYREN